MSIIERLRRRLAGLPLGEVRDSEQLEDRAVLQRLAAQLPAGPAILWTGWGFAARGAGEDESLPAAAIAVVDGAVAWATRDPESEGERVELTGSVIWVERSTRRIRVGGEGPEDPGVAVLAAHDQAALLSALDQARA